VDTEHCKIVDAVTGNALRAHELATESTGAARIVEVTRQAIRSWRGLAQLDDPGHIGPASVDKALDTKEYRFKRRDR
jgi:hypothetical protein